MTTTPRIRPIIDGLFYEGSITTLVGAFNMGKTPLIKDWSVTIASGREWCGQPTFPHPIIIIDFESRDFSFFEGAKPEFGGWNHICARYGVRPEGLPVQFHFFHGDYDSPATKEMMKVDMMETDDKFKWIEAHFEKTPAAIMFIDPLQLLFNFDKLKSTNVVHLYHRFQRIQQRYRRATFVFTFNPRKRNPQFAPPPIIEDPHTWLQELPGSMDLQSRADIRLGVDSLFPDDRSIIVVNGAIREQTMEPFIIEAEWYKERAAGFRRVDPSTLDLEKVLSKKMKEVWHALSDTFTREELFTATNRTTAYRFESRALGLGLVKRNGVGAFQKMV